MSGSSVDEHVAVLAFIIVERYKRVGALNVAKSAIFLLRNRFVYILPDILKFFNISRPSDELRSRQLGLGLARPHNFVNVHLDVIEEFLQLLVVN